MARQKSEDCTVPKGRRKAVPTRRLEASGGGKAVPVNEQTGQLALRFGTAEDLAAQAAGADGGADTGRPVPAPRAAPKPRRKEKTATSATMEEVTKRLYEAFDKVASKSRSPRPRSAEHRPGARAPGRDRAEAERGPAFGLLRARRHPARMDRKARRWSARARDSQRGRPHGAGSRTAGPRTAV
jgi:hypothetical protein